MAPKRILKSPALPIPTCDSWNFSLATRKTHVKALGLVNSGMLASPKESHHKQGREMSSSERQGQGLICASFPELLVSTLMNLTCGGVGTAHESAGWTERKWFFGGGWNSCESGRTKGVSMGGEGEDE